MKVFYHNDLDGKCAAAVILQKDPDAEIGTCTVKMQYGDDFPFGCIGKDETVYILDYSIEPEEMKKLLRITENVIWIDHHKTAIEKYADFLWVDSGLAERTASEADIPGLRQEWGSGCELAFAYIHAITRRTSVSAARGNTPRYVQLIGDRDTWAWEYGNDTRDFFAGMLSQDADPSSPVWESLANDDTGAFLYKTMADGQIIDAYRSLNHQEALIDTGFEVDFRGHKCYAVNGRYDSKPFEALFPEKDIWLTFRFMGKNKCWMVSLYSDKVDVSEIAKQYEYHGKRGGGHKGAAGFECDYPPFLLRSTDES